MQNNVHRRFDTFIVFMILSCPFIDLITSLSINWFQVSLPITNLLRGVLVITVVWYMFLHTTTTRKRFFIFYIIALAIFGCLYMLQFSHLGIGLLFDEAKWLIKFFNYPILLFCFYCIFEDRNCPIKSKHLIISLLFYMLLITLPTVFQVNFNGYTQGKIGSVGFFNSVNEIGAILSILYPILLLQVHRLKKPLLIATTIAGSGLVFFLLGSKTPIIIYVAVNACYVLFFMKRLYQSGQKRKFILLSTSILVFIVGSGIYVTQTNFYYNMVLHLEFLNISSLQDLISFNGINRFVFSDRLTLAANEFQLYSSADTTQQLLGLGSFVESTTGYVERKTIEMDLIDLFVKFGIVGFTLYLIPLGLLFTDIMNKFKTVHRVDLELLMFICTVAAAFSIAFLSGHVLSAPSVSLLIIAIQSLLLEKVQKSKEIDFTKPILNT